MRIRPPTVTGLIGCLTWLLCSPAAVAEPPPVPPPDPPGAYPFRVYQYAYLHPDIAGRTDAELPSDGYRACRMEAPKRPE